MSPTRTTTFRLMTAGALISLLVGMVTIVRRAGGPTVAPSELLIVAQPMAPEVDDSPTLPPEVAPEPTSATESPTTKPPTTEPSTTIAPATTVPPVAPPTTRVPVPTTARVVVTAPPAPVVTTPPPPVVPPTPSSAERCAAARQWVAGQGLAVPAGWVFRCPSAAIINGVPHAGLACWNCEGSGSWIAIDIGRAGWTETSLRYVIAHEICHAIEFMTLGLSTELTADVCAALHGAPRP